MQEEAAGRMEKGIKREAESVQTPSDVSETVANAPGQSDLEQNPQIVLELLEADQVVAAKERTRFGRRPLSRLEEVLLWGLRIYVVVMFAIVALWVFRTFHVAH